MKNTIFIVFLIIGNHILGSEEDARTYLLSEEQQRDGLDVQPEYKVDDDISFEVDSTIASLTSHPTKPQIALSGCDNGKVSIYGFDSKLKQAYSVGHPVTALQWTPQGRLVAATFKIRNQNTLHILEEKSREFKGVMSILGRVHSLTFTGGDKPCLLVVYRSKADSTAQTNWGLGSIDSEFSEVYPIEPAQKEQINALATGKKESSTWAAYSIGKTIQFLKQTGDNEFEKRQYWRVGKTVKQLEFCPEDARLCIATDENIYIRELSTGITIRSVSIPGPIVTLGSVQLEEQQVVGVTAMGRVLMLDWLGQEQTKECQLNQQVKYACINSARQMLITGSGRTIHITSLAALLKQPESNSESGSENSEDGSSCCCGCLIM